MRLSELIEGLGVRLVSGEGGAFITDVTEDSRGVTPGCLFVARRGRVHDGREFAAGAAAAGAAAVLTDDPELARRLGEEGRGSHACAVLVTSDVAGATAKIAERFCGNPSRKIRVIGITGTNGKTTIATAVQQVFNAGGMKCGLMGTVVNDDGREARRARLTTPSAIEVSRMLAAMAANGCKAAAMEVSSHSLDQARVAGVQFQVGVFTNLTGDHLDYHGTMDRYGAAKARLFEMLPGSGTAVVNFDDPWGDRMVRGTRARVMRCSALMHHTCRVETLASSIDGMRLRLSGPWGAFEVGTGLIGAHNAMNLLQVCAACHGVGMGREELRRGLAAVKAPPGRLERVDPGVGSGPAVFVDYAHTDDAMERVMQTLLPLRAGGRLWVVFGCGGDRDRTKRPRMGQVAARLADVAVVTSDNSRTEDPDAIIAEVLGGMDEAARARAKVLPVREEAIEAAVSGAGAGDIVLIAGKGHETEQIVPDGRGGVVKRHFDDAEEARRALQRRGQVRVVLERSEAHA